jgi:hypothetical protein
MGADKAVDEFLFCLARHNAMQRPVSDTTTLLAAGSDMASSGCKRVLSHV